VESSKLNQLRIEREPEGGSEPGRGLTLTAAVVALALVAAGAWYWLRPAPAVSVTTALAREVSGQSANTVLNASGYVTARREATVSSKFTARVTEILIEEGMRVEEGQVMARLDDSNLQASYKLAEAQVRAAQTGLKETQALLKEARANLERTRNLVERKLSSQADLDRAVAQADSLAAQLEVRQADVMVAKRQLGVYAQQLEDTVIRAPFAGVVVSKNAQPGEMISPVSAGGGFTRTGIGTVVDMDSLEIEIDVNEAYINRVSAGQAVLATLDAYPDWHIPCHVIAIVPTADRDRATVEVRVGFDALDPRILPDMGVKVAFQEETGDETAATAVAVPETAVGNEAGRSVVWVVAEGRVERRAVATGGKRNGEALILSGLNRGDKVVIDAPPGLADGARVRESD